MRKGFEGKLPGGAPFSFAFFRDGKFPRDTVCLLFLGDPIEWDNAGRLSGGSWPDGFGRAHCAEIDQPNKEIGRKLALRRAVCMAIESAATYTDENMQEVVVRSECEQKARRKVWLTYYKKRYADSERSTTRKCGWPTKNGAHCYQTAKAISRSEGKPT